MSRQNILKMMQGTDLLLIEKLPQGTAGFPIQACLTTHDPAGNLSPLHRGRQRN